MTIERAHASQETFGGAGLLSDYSVRLVGAREGVATTTVHALAQTRTGWLWLGLHGGVARFDGLRAEPVTLATRIAPHSQVQDIFEDAGGAVWLSTMLEGVVRLSGATESHFGAAEGLPSSNVGRVCRDRHGVLWAGTSDGAARFEGGRFSTVRRPELKGWGRQGGYGVFCTSHGVLVATSAGPPWWVPGTTASDAPPLPQAETYVSLQTRDGAIWLGGIEAGLVRIANGGIRTFGDGDGLPAIRITALIEDRTGDLWIGTWGAGVFRWRPGAARFGSLTRHQGLPADTITALLEDREGHVWVGTTAGLVQLRPRIFARMALPGALASRQPGPVWAARDGAIWVGTDGAGVARWANGDWETFSTAQGVPSDRIFALHQDPQGRLFVGTNHGLARFDGSRFVKLAKTHPHDLDEIRAFFSDSRGDLWMGLGGTGVARLSDAGVRYFGAVDGLDESYVRAFAEAGDGSIWVGGESALHRLQGERFVKAVDLKHLGAPGHTRVESLLALAEGTWLGASSGGLFSVRRDVATELPPPGLAHVAELARDGAGDILVVGRGGILRAPEDAFLRSARDGSPLPFARFDTADGLADADFSYPAAPHVARATDGTLVFSTATEVVSTTAARLFHRPFTPQVHVHRVLIDDRPLSSVFAPARLAPGHHRITVSYTAPAFAHPERLRFETMLAGYEDSWQDAGTSREVTFAGLGPGHYALHMRAAGARAAGSRFDFSIAPFWYQRTLLQFVLVAGLVMLTASLAVAVRSRRMRARFTALDEERNRIARELHDGLEQNLTGILLRLGTAEGGLPAAHPARPHLEAARSIVRHVHADVRHQVWDLRGRGASHAGLRSALEALMETPRAAGLTATVRIDEPLPALSAEIETTLLRVAQEAVTNTIKHAGAHTLQLHLGPRSGAIALTIEDDGRGYDETLVSAAPGHHLGLVGMRERTEAMNGQLHIETGPGRGVTIHVVIPDARERSTS
jgi:signal transduction histidine kinase/ligand-binding sensor domain-containing protein